MFCDLVCNDRNAVLTAQIEVLHSGGIFEYHPTIFDGCKNSIDAIIFDTILIRALTILNHKLA